MNDPVFGHLSPNAKPSEWHSHPSLMYGPGPEGLAILASNTGRTAQQIRRRFARIGCRGRRSSRPSPVVGTKVRA